MRGVGGGAGASPALAGRSRGISFSSTGSSGGKTPVANPPPNASEMINALKSEIIPKMMSIRMPSGMLVPAQMRSPCRRRDMEAAPWHDGRGARSIGVKPTADELAGGGRRTCARGVPRGMHATQCGSWGAQLEGRLIGRQTEWRGRCGKSRTTAERTLVLEVGGQVAWHRSSVTRDYAFRRAERRRKPRASRREGREPVQCDCQDEKPDSTPVGSRFHGREYSRPSQNVELGCRGHVRSL